MSSKARDILRQLLADYPNGPMLTMVSESAEVLMDTDASSDDQHTALDNLFCLARAYDDHARNMARLATEAPFEKGN